MSEHGDLSQPYTLTVDLPTDGMPQHGVAIVAWFDSQGNTRYGFTMEGETSLSGILGLLEIVKARVLKEAEGW